MANLRIREVRGSDIPELLGMMRSAFAEELALHGGLHPTEARLAFWFYRVLRLVEIWRGRPVARFFVAEEEGKTVGGAMVVWREGYAYLQLVMVHPGYRGRGIGRGLVTHALSEAFRLGAPKAVLHVRADNEPALGLYRSLGLRPFEERVVLVWEGGDSPKGGPLPAGWSLARLRPLNRRGWAIAEAAREPEAAAVYGPSPRPRGLWRAAATFAGFATRGWLLMNPDGPVAALWLGRGKCARLALHLPPSHRGQGLEASLLCFALTTATQQRSVRVVLRTSAQNAELLQSAAALGFTEKFRELGMVLERGRT